MFRIELPENTKSTKRRHKGKTRLLVTSDIGAACRQLAKHEARPIDDILRDALTLYVRAQHPDATMA